MPLGDRFTKRPLRAEIDEAAWEALYTTKSRQFEKGYREEDTDKPRRLEADDYAFSQLRVFDLSADLQARIPDNCGQW